MNHTPQNIDVNEKELIVKWEDHPKVFSAQFLRQYCPCAQCVSEVTGELLLNRDRVPADIKISHAEPTGNYAVSLSFSDGHKTGIYAYEFLRRLK